MYFIILPIISQGHRWALKAAQVQGVKQSKMDESEDMEITVEKLTAVYSLVVDVSDRVREKVRGKEWEGEGGKGRVKVVINLMEKSNTKQIHSSKLDASVVLFLARAKP